MKSALFVDGHVHIHSCFDLKQFFCAAHGNLSKAAAERGYGEGQWQGALLLTEAGSARVFERLVNGSLLPPQGITIVRTGDKAALRVTVEGGNALYLFAGRQVATTSGVEVLSLATCDVVPDGLTFEAAMDRSCATDGLTVIPWGFGKWLLKRGEMVQRQLTQRSPGSIALGDNGGRLRFAPSPQLFGLAEKLGFAILPGSDPFPFSSQYKRVGSFGFILDQWHEDQDLPTSALLSRLRGLKVSPTGFGRLTGLGSFAVSQVRMQVHNRLATQMSS